MIGLKVKVPLTIEPYLRRYLANKPFFLGLIRSKEASLYQPYLPFEKPVLDVGCGDGFFAKTAFSRRSDFKSIDVGLDLPDSRINEADKIGIYKKITTYDGKEMPFKNCTFLTVISNSVLEHVDSLETVLSEIHRVLKPGGIFLTTVMAKPWEDSLFGAKLFGDTYKKWMKRKQVHKNLLTEKEWTKLFRETGFVIKEKSGYLPQRLCRLIEICHYLSLPSLVSYNLFGKWVLFPFFAERIYPINYLSRLLDEESRLNDSGSLWFVLKKW